MASSSRMASILRHLNNWHMTDHFKALISGEQFTDVYKRQHQPRPHLRGRRVHPRRSRPDRLHQVRRQLRCFHQGR